MQGRQDDTAKDLFHFERLARQNGYSRIAGVDEVGRGPLAGPVVAAAVILPPDACELPLRDSKVLSSGEREFLAAELWRRPNVHIAISTVSSEEIDRVNILRATQVAMREATSRLQPQPDFALVDGLSVPDFPVPVEFLVRGDARCASIAAASIIAKVYRDALMRDLDRQYPGYGFARHKGYGTQAHLAALETLGACPVHRRSFAPVRRVETPAPEQMELVLSGPE